MGLGTRIRNGGSSVSQRLYVNQVTVRLVAEDVALLASWLENPGEVPFNQENAPQADYQIYMSPAMAKKLLRALGKSIEQYEMVFGTIPTDPNLEAAQNLVQNLPPGTTGKVITQGEE